MSTTPTKDDSIIADFADSFENANASSDQAKKPKINCVTYMISDTFNTQAEAEAFVKQELCWSLKKMVYTEEGEKKHTWPSM